MDMIHGAMLFGAFIGMGLGFCAGLKYMMWWLKKYGCERCHRKSSVIHPR